MSDRKKTGPESDIMTVREVAGYLNCHSATIYRLLGMLGGLVRSEAKWKSNRENGRKGGLVKSRKKKIAARRNARRPRPGRRKNSSKL